MILLILLACQPSPAVDTPGAGGALGEGALNPFPSMELMRDGQVAIPAGALPQVEGGTALDVARLDWREGFSRVQTSVVTLPVGVDPASLPGEAAVGVGGSIRMFDLDTEEEIPLFAELDAHPDALASGERALLIRPARAMTPGHHIAVALTDAVTVDGAPIRLDAWAAAKAADPHYAALEATLSGLGVSGVALAWDFPVGDGTAPVRALASAVSVPASWEFTRILDADTEPEGNLPPGVWKKIEGTYTSDTWLVDDTAFVLGADGVPNFQGTDAVYLYVHIPDAVRDLPPGNAPVFVFGHGVLSEPSNYFDKDDDPSALIELSNRLGGIFVATVWRGLTADDNADTVAMAADFGRFPELTDRVTQGVANTLALIRLVDEGGLLDDPIFAGKADRSRIYWYGISLGAIEGAVTLANQDRIQHAVLHVGGSAWSTMLERSSNWPVFETLLERGIPDPADRQLLLATTQLFWDPVDPASYIEDLAGRTFLFQEAIGDDQVPNLTTELLMRSLGVASGTPAATAPYGIDTISLPTSAPVFTQFDPGLGMPPAENRPAEATGAHGAPRLWEGCKAQTIGFFAAGAEGQVAHYCGSAPCSASNRGE